MIDIYDYISGEWTEWYINGGITSTKSRHLCVPTGSHLKDVQLKQKGVPVDSEPDQNSMIVHSYISIKLTK